MSIYIYVYCDRTADEVTPLVEAVAKAHPDEYDLEGFHAPFPVRRPEPVDASTLHAIDRYGFTARSYFVVLLNDKALAGPEFHLAVGRFVHALGPFRALALVEGESVFPTTEPGPVVLPSIDDARRLLGGLAEADLHGPRASRIRTWLASFVEERPNADALAALMPETSSTARALIADALTGSGGGTMIIGIAVGRTTSIAARRTSAPSRFGDSRPVPSGARRRIHFARTPSPTMNDALLERARDAAARAADAAADTVAGFLARGDWSVSYKGDASPVTEVDVAAERRIRAVLADAFPDAAFFGEETGASEGVPVAPGGAADGPRLRWLVDPIDGTKSFVRGQPFWSTQIALEVDGELVVGVSSAPAFGERLVAARGAGATLERRVGPHVGAPRVGTSTVARLDDAFLSSGNLGSLAADPARWARYGALVARARRTRGYGDFLHYHQLCVGETDLVIESDLNILDVAALTVAVREAGGTITDLGGAPIGHATTSVLAAATAGLHAAALEALGG